MAAIPVGDILRAFVNPKTFLGKLLAKLKGTKITTPGGTDILLDEKPGAYPAGRSPLDSVPHRPEPPTFGPRR